MCGIAGEIARGRPADLTAVAAMTESMVPARSRQQRNLGSRAAWRWATVGWRSSTFPATVISRCTTPNSGSPSPSTDASTTTPSSVDSCSARVTASSRTATPRSSLKGYREWGERVVDHLKGMFAFAIAENDSGRVILARDRLGVKPLYWCDVDGADGRVQCGSPRHCPPRGRRAGSTPNRPGGPAPLSVVPLRRARRPAPSCAACASSRRARSCASNPTAGGRRTTYWEPVFERLARARRLVGARVGGGHPRIAAHRGRAPPRRRRARRRACSRAAWTPASSSDCSPRPGQHGLATFSHRLRGRRRRRGRRVQVLRRHRPPLRHRPPPDPHRHRAHAAVAHGRDRRDERADDEP